MNNLTPVRDYFGKQKDKLLTELVLQVNGFGILIETNYVMAKGA